MEERTVKVVKSKKKILYTKYLEDINEDATEEIVKSNETYTVKNEETEGKEVSRILYKFFRWLRYTTLTFIILIMILLSSVGLLALLNATTRTMIVQSIHSII